MIESAPKKRLFFNKYQIKRLIYRSKLCFVYEGINIKTNEHLAMKFEKKDIKGNMLEKEAYYLINLKGFGIPRIITFGKSGTFNLLIEELLGLSIFRLWFEKKIKDKNIILKNICMIAIQCLDRLEYIHSKNIIHRDIKPENFVIGKNDPNVLYLIDFGFSKKYRSSRTGKHIKYQNIKKAFGSIMYMSCNSNKGYELSRRDDLESLGYMLIHLAKNNLPWLKLDKLKLKSFILNQEVLKMKKSITIQELCKDLPDEFAEYLKYSKELKFEQEPNYNYLKNLFMSILNRNHQKMDFLFFWINTKKRNNKNEENSFDKKFDFFRKRKCNSQNRLYCEIKKSLNKSKSHKKFNFHIKNIKIQNSKSMSKDSKIFYNKENNSYVFKKKIQKNKINIRTNNCGNNLDKNKIINFKTEFNNINNMKINNNIIIYNNENSYNNKFDNDLKRKKIEIPLNKINKNLKYKKIISNNKNLIEKSNSNGKIEQSNFQLKNKIGINLSHINIFNMSKNKHIYRTLEEREKIKSKRSYDTNNKLYNLKKIYNFNKNFFINLTDIKF